MLPPIFKKGSKNSKDDFRQINILKNLLKVFEKIIYKQMATVVYEHFSKFQSGSRKRYNIPQCLIALIEKWKSVVDS